MTLSRPWLNRILACIGSPTAQFADADVLAAREAHHQAFPLFARAARAGLPDAQARLGQCYLLGLGVPADKDEALHWLTCAGEAGNVAAQAHLAALAMQGVSPRDEAGLFGQIEADASKPDYDSAERWGRLAAAGGSTEAKALLGFILSGRLEDQQGKAVSRETQAAATDCLCAQDDGEAANLAEAAIWFQRAAEAGHIGAARTLGRMKLDGTGLRRDASEAAHWLRIAAAGGDEAAQQDLVRLALGCQATKPDQRAAAAELREAAEDGIAAAQFKLGLCFADGIGLERNEAAARGWYLRAAAQGMAEGAMAAGEMLVKGRGGPRDLTQALALFRRAAASGRASAHYALGVLLADDEAAARNCFEQAATLGHPAAKVRLERLPEPA